jgi:tetratricopeptide (TPR) repeat protein
MENSIQNQFAEPFIPDMDLIPDIDFTRWSADSILAVAQAQTDLLSPPATLTPWQWAQYCAIANWLHYEPDADASNLEKVRGYLEAIYHCHELEAWEAASQLLVAQPKKCQQPLHEQLGTWGYYREQIELYESLLNQVPPEINGLCLNGLSYASIRIGRLTRSLEYSRLQQKLAWELKDSRLQLEALNNLSYAYYTIGNYQSTIIFAEQHLELAQQHSDIDHQIKALHRLALVLNEQQQLKGQSQAKIAYQKLQQAMLLLPQARDPKLKLQLLGGLSATLSNLGKPSMAIACIEQQKQLAQELGDRYQLCIALCNLGGRYLQSNNLAQAQAHATAALELAQEMGAQYLEMIALNISGVLFSFRLRQYAKGRVYLEQCLTLMRLTGRTSRLAAGLVNLAGCLAYLHQPEAALAYANEARELAIALDDRQNQGLALAAIANVHWQSRRYITGLHYAIQALITWQPWQANGRMMGQLILEEILQKLREWFWLSSKA